MRLFDGSAEYVRAAELKAGDTIREDGQWRKVLDAGTYGQHDRMARVVCEDGYGFDCPAPTRILRKLP